MARMNKNDIVRSRIVDEVVEVLDRDGSLLGTYENKPRFEVIDDEGNIYQYSVAITLHKVLVDAEECDKYLDTDAKLAAFQAGLKPKVEKPAKPKKAKKDKVEDSVETQVMVTADICPPVDHDTDAQAAANALAALGIEF